MLLLMAALAALVGPAAANLVTIEAEDYSIALNVDLVKNDSQEMETGSMTYPLIVRGSEGSDDAASATNFSRQVFSIGSASEDVKDLPHNLLTLESYAEIQLDTYPEPPEGGLDTTPVGLGEEVDNISISVVKNVTVGWINPIQTPMYKVAVTGDYGNGDGADLPEVYFVLFAVDDVTTCRIVSVYGFSGEMGGEEFEEFLKNLDVLLNVRSSGGYPVIPIAKNEQS